MDAADAKQSSLNAPFSPLAADADVFAEAMQRIIEKLADGSIKRVRFAFSDLHGETRCKTLLPSAALRALEQGLYVAGTTLLKDTSDRTALAVFNAGDLGALSSFANAANLLLRADPGTFRMLPWSPGTAWILCQTFYIDGRACEIDPRERLASQVERLRTRGWRLRCGIELEFHVYRTLSSTTHLDPSRAAWPGPAPDVEMIHPGYRLLSEQSTDAAHEVLELIEGVAGELQLPLASLEIEFGPSQFEAVFEVQDALAAADTVVLFRSAVRQVLARHGYYASFACRPPFPAVMSSGWHLHQSLVDESSRNVFVDAPNSALESTKLSEAGRQWLAGLMHHALGACLLGTTTANGYARYQPGALAPTRIFWGYEDRSALFRVVGQNQSLRIENRLGEPSANPYLYLASQVICGLDGIDQGRTLDPPERRDEARAMPSDLSAAIHAFQDCQVLQQHLGAPLCQVLKAAKTTEWNRFKASEDQDEFQRREYFGRF